jgi:hypothetical protein
MLPSFSTPTVTTSRPFACSREGLINSYMRDRALWAACRSVEQGAPLGMRPHRHAQARAHLARCIPLRGRIHRAIPMEPAPPRPGALGVEERRVAGLHERRATTPWAHSAQSLYRVGNFSGCVRGGPCCVALLANVTCLSAGRAAPRRAQAWGGSGPKRPGLASSNERPLRPCLFERPSPGRPCSHPHLTQRASCELIRPSLSFLLGLGLRGGSDIGLGHAGHLFSSLDHGLVNAPGGFDRGLGRRESRFGTSRSRLHGRVE